MRRCTLSFCVPPKLTLGEEGHFSSSFLHTLKLKSPRQKFVLAKKRPAQEMAAHARAYPRLHEPPREKSRLVNATRGLSRLGLHTESSFCTF